MDVWSIKETFLDDFYHLNQNAPFHNGTIIDIGAGIGEFAIQAAAACPDCRIIGFEPFPESFDLFNKNTIENGLNNVTTVKAAVTSVAGNLVMDTSTGNPLQYRMQSDTSISSEISIKTITLVEYLYQQGIQKCDLLKLDCEGGEYDILLPLSKTDLHIFGRIVMEFHDSLTPHSHHELVNLLNSAGFRVHIVPNKVHSDLGYIYAQYI
jgi:FkbM family methyltransferase